MTIGYRLPHIRANGVNTSVANVEVLPPPGVSRKYQILRLELSTKTADDITLKSGETVIATYFMGVTSSRVICDDELWLDIGVNEPFVLTKGSAGTNVSWVIHYRVVTILERAFTAPINNTPPAISGTGVVGAVLTLNEGIFEGNPTPTLARQWRLNGVNIGGQTGTTYTVQAGDVGGNIDCVVTATNSEGSLGVASNNITGQSAGSPPVNTVAPVLSGTPDVGQVLSCTTGSWTGSPTITYAYQWRRNGSNISGATGSTYTLVNADGGASITCRVTATNGSGSASATSGGVTINYASEYAAISGLVASWEFDKAAGFQTYNGNVLAGYLPDVSNNGYNASQPQLLFNPLYDAVNGITYGPDMFLQVFNPVNLLSNVSGFTVVYNGTISSGAAAKTVLGINRPGGSSPQMAWFSIAGTSSNKMRFQGRPNEITGSNLSYLSTGSVTLDTPVKLVWVVDIAANTITFYQNGVNIGTVTTAFPAGNTVTGTPSSVVLGAEPTIQTSGSSASWQTTSLANKAYMKKMHIFNRVLTPSEVAAL
jgi:hypothetical protein